MKPVIPFTLLLIILLHSVTGICAKQTSGKVLYIASYHTEKDEWSQGIREGTEQYKPDIVIISDDNAAKYLVQPYLLESEIPIIFCGINYDASPYNLPTPNSTGMIEIEPIIETVIFLRRYASGERIGYIGRDDLSNAKTIHHEEQLLGAPFTAGYLVSTFEEWKKAYITLQDQVDMLILLNPIGIDGWSPEEAQTFIIQSSKIPSGAINVGEIHYSPLGHVKIGEEQGWWAGKTGRKILEGTHPSDIPVARNSKSRLYLNPLLANAIGIHFPIQLIKSATLVQSEHE